MGITGINNSTPLTAAALQSASQPQSLKDSTDPLQRPDDRPEGELREVFNRFVGQTFYSQLLGAMRKTVGQPAYFHGGRAEEVFQSQLDQVLSEQLSDTTAERFTDPMFELFNLNRSS